MRPVLGGIRYARGVGSMGRDFVVITLANLASFSGELLRYGNVLGEY
jgi:hypothetical protein